MFHQLFYTIKVIEQNVENLHKNENNILVRLVTAQERGVLLSAAGKEGHLEVGVAQGMIKIRS